MGRRSKGGRGNAPHAGELEFFARCAGGFEEVLGRELRSLGLRRVRPQVGGVIFFGALADGYRACLWSRVATRIQLVLARVSCEDADALYHGVQALPWEDHIRDRATIAVDAHGENPNLRNTKFVALKVKDALCDRMRETCGMRPNVDPARPDVAVNVAVHPRKATVYLNLSGESLHRRGYRLDGVQTEAPLKETLAAGILLAAEWDGLTEQGAFLADPMCGSGTLAIEAALIAAHIAPGLLRERWGFEGWSGHDRELWEMVRAEAEASRTYEGGPARIMAGDIDPHAIEIARANARRAGVDGLASFFVDDAARLGRHLRLAHKRRDVPGLLVANPPYGERLGTHDELPLVYAALSEAIEVTPSSWQVALITPDPAIDTSLGRAPREVMACHNGPIETWVRRYDRSEPRQVLDVASLGGGQHKVPVADANSSQFGARLRKAAKERLRWARREGVSCLRLYDADLPDYALSVDLYEGAGVDEGKRFALVEERRRPASVDAQRAIRRFADASALVSAVLDVSAGQVVARPWQAADQRRGHKDPVPLEVEESGLTFSIDLAGRPDTGLPLQLRGIRKMVGSLSAGVRVANLFATTGAATVFAARGGAASTVTVDAFADRVDAVRQAMRANGFATGAHRYVCEDARTWAAREVRAHHAYDLVVCAPPTWIAGQGKQADWELQRDHVQLLTEVERLLSKKGVIVFAGMSRGFALDLEALQSEGLVAEDVSASTLPHDFERTSRDFACYLIRKA